MFKKTAVILFFILVCVSSVYCTEPKPLFTSAKLSKTPLVRTRVSIAPLISFYKINKNHASKPTQKMSGLFSIKEEIRLNDKHNMFFLVGVEYMLHGMNFNSYYFKQDSIQLYTGTFNARYSLYIHEIDIPLQLKISFSRENNSVFSGYFMAGYHFRMLLAGDLKVKQNGELIEKRIVDVSFKNPLFTDRTNPFVSLTLGLQKNNPDNTRRCMFAEISYRFGFSPYLIKDPFAPSSLYMNGSHLALAVGYKF